MDLLSNYQGFRKCEVILVFDAYKVPRNTGEVVRYHNIYVVYTREAETADAYIEKATYEIGKKHRVRVATSDGAEQLIILGHGALRLSASAFRAELERTGGEIRAILERNNRRVRSQPVKAALDRAGEARGGERRGHDGQAYTRLKLKMLLLVVAGTLGAGRGPLPLGRWWWTACSRTPLPGACCGCARTCSAVTRQGALEIYQHVFRNHKGTWLLVGTILPDAGGLYVAMGRFIRWLDQIGAAVRQVVNETGETVRLPKELRPVEGGPAVHPADPGTAGDRGQGSGAAAAGPGGFPGPDLKTPLTSVLGYLNLLHDELDSRRSSGPNIRASP